MTTKIDDFILVFHEETGAKPSETKLLFTYCIRSKMAKYYKCIEVMH